MEVRRRLDAYGRAPSLRPGRIKTPDVSVNRWTAGVCRAERCAAEDGDVAPTSDHDWVAIDFETATGRRASACAVGLVEVRDGRIVGTESFLLSLIHI